MGLLCDDCDLPLSGPEERKAIGGKCPICGKQMYKTRPATEADRQELIRLIRGGKTRVEGDETKN